MLWFHARDFNNKSLLTPLTNFVNLNLSKTVSFTLLWGHACSFMLASLI